MARARAAHAKASDDEAGHSGRLLLRMPPDLHGELARAAERDGSSLNAFITRILSDAVAGDSPRSEPPPSGSRLLRIALIADLVLVAVAAIAAVALLLVASL